MAVAQVEENKKHRTQPPPFSAGIVLKSRIPEEHGEGAREVSFTLAG